ncbi:MAG: deoxyuridine 5'-triphosphate nucleotidohydrolase [Chloroflexi bacterium]|nr:MAG: deoxyuridine 5'-triphosphate nucleotidohydrolase [Chloroflexota bacterium]
MLNESWSEPGLTPVSLVRGDRASHSAARHFTRAFAAWETSPVSVLSREELRAALAADPPLAAREDVPSDKDGWWDLHRGAYVITYREKVNLPRDLMALARPRSTLLRSGVEIHAAVWDAGYSGRGEGLMSVLNARGYRLQRGARVLQLVFFRLSTPAAEGYRGRYQGENLEKS